MDNFEAERERLALILYESLVESDLIQGRNLLTPHIAIKILASNWVVLKSAAKIDDLRHWAVLKCNKGLQQRILLRFLEICEERLENKCLVEEGSLLRQWVLGENDKILGWMKQVEVFFA